MKNTLIRITAAAALFIFSACITNSAKAQSDVQASAQPGDVYETRAAVIVGVNYSDSNNTTAYIVQDVSTGVQYPFNVQGVPAFQVGDHVCVTVQKTVKGTVIIRDITR